jgi:outer membrane protein assembly factor BamB
VRIIVGGGVWRTGAGRPSWAFSAVAVCAVAGGLALVGSPAGASARSATAATGAPLSASAATDWPAYLDGPRHNSYSPAETAISPATAADLVNRWTDALGGGVLASPSVAGGYVYVGAGNGWFYQLDEATGAVRARFFTGHQPAKTCGAVGDVSTATVGTDPVTHRATVYVAGASGYLYALRASDLRLEWRAVVALPSSKISDYYTWSSPTVADGTIYIGVSSNCDHPLVYAGVIAYRQATGQELAEFHTVPRGDIGGSVWSSVAVAANGDVYATTGNGPENKQLLGDSDSILKLAPRTLKLLGRFQVPASQLTYDGDFGSSPLLFGNYVGACDKNGIFYVLSQSTMKLAWQLRIGAESGIGEGECLATPAYNGTDLFIGGNATTLDGITYPGYAEQYDLATGTDVWAAGLGGEAIGSPALDGGGVLAVPVFSSQNGGIDLIDASTGTILAQLDAGEDFAQATFADNQLFTATVGGVAARDVQPGRATGKARHQIG